MFYKAPNHMKGGDTSKTITRRIVWRRNFVPNPIISFSHTEEEEKIQERGRNEKLFDETIQPSRIAEQAMTDWVDKMTWIKNVGGQGLLQDENRTSSFKLSLSMGFSK